MSDYGIQVTKEGSDTEFATGDDLLLDTSKKNLKYVRNVYFSSLGQYAHRLGYTPVCFGWSKDSNNWWNRQSYSFVPSTSGGTAVSGGAYADDTYVYGRAGQYVEYLADRGFTDTGDRIEGTYGIQISAPDTDVEEAAPYDLVFDSAFNTYKIFKSGTVTLSWAEGVEGWINEDITHNLGYAPKVMLFGEDGQEPVFYSTGYSGEEIFSYYSNTTTLRVTGTRADFYGGMFGPLPAYSQTFTYFIFIDRIDDDGFE